MALIGTLGRLKGNQMCGIFYGRSLLQTSEAQFSKTRGCRFETTRYSAMQMHVLSGCFETTAIFVNDKQKLFETGATSDTSAWTNVTYVRFVQRVW